jgi:feruloyl-CoA synthase
VPRDVEVIYEAKERPVSAALDAAHGMVGPDTIAKFLFTSGSTGAPKAVINTQRMWCSNQKLTATMFACFQEEPPVLVEWAPWHHTGGRQQGLRHGALQRRLLLHRRRQAVAGARSKPR